MQYSALAIFFIDGRDYWIVRIRGR